MNQEARIEDVLEKAHRFKSEIGQSVHDQYVERLFQEDASISKESVTKTPIRYLKDEKIDRILTSKLWGFPTMIGLFTLVIWLTIEGANVPSSMLATFSLTGFIPF